jgi:hypothetical protein
MVSVADCLRQHAPAYLAKYGDAVPLGHRKVIAAITRCRTGALGGILYGCGDCGTKYWVGRSCGNRHCPTCGHDKTAAWLETQSRRQMPMHHFLVTFTVSEELRSVLRACQGPGYAALFRSGADSIRDVASATKSLRGCRMGFFGVLHTWGRDPCVYNPHVHFVVPGGGVREDRSKWKATPENFLFHHGTLIRVYKAKLADALRACDLYDRVPAGAWKAKFVVNIKPVGDGQAVLKYLAPYIHRVAISDNRIVACDEASVTYRYTPSGTEQSKTRRVTGNEFVRGFVQHTLPSGFQKVRHYGWMSSNCRISLAEVKWLVWLFLGWTYWLASGHAPQEAPSRKTPVCCPHCGGEMHIIDIAYYPVPATLLEHPIPYLDSG